MVRRARSIKLELMFSYISIIVLVSFIMSGLYFYQVYFYTAKESGKYIEQISEQAGNELNSMLEQLEIAQYQMTGILISKTAFGEDSNKATKELLKFRSELEDEMRNVRRSFGFINGIYWIDRCGSVYATNSSISADKLMQEEWLRSFCIGEEESKAILPHSINYLINYDDNHLVYTSVKNIYNVGKNLRKEGVLQFDIEYGAIHRILSLLNSDENRISFITDDQGKVVYFSDVKYIGEYYAGINYSGFDLSVINQQFFYESELNNGWKLITVFNNQKTIESFKNNIKYSLIIMSAIILVTIIIAYMHSRFITKPIECLTQYMRGVEEGNLNVVELNSHNTELLILEHGYNSMVTKIEGMIRKMVNIRAESVKARLLALQSQINPHFLSNLFDTIRSIAIQENTPKIESLTASMATMYRYILSDSSAIVSFREELEHVKHYIRIQKFRFGDTMQVFYQIEKQTLDCQMHKLLLQPIVENAFSHGLEPKEGIKYIIISSVLKEGKVEIMVKDNGVGILENELKEIKESISNFSEIMDGDTKNYNAKKDHNIGLRNVNTRLYFSYGKEACLNIESQPGHGTMVSFSFPGV